MPRTTTLRLITVSVSQGDTLLFPVHRRERQKCRRLAHPEIISQHSHVKRTIITPWVGRNEVNVTSGKLSVGVRLPTPVPLLNVIVTFCPKNRSLPTYAVGKIVAVCVQEVKRMPRAQVKVGAFWDSISVTILGPSYIISIGTWPGTTIIYPRQLQGLPGLVSWLKHLEMKRPRIQSIPFTNVVASISYAEARHNTHL
jgi:hypothetical protein